MVDRKEVPPEQETEGDEFSAAGLSVEDEIGAAEQLKNTSPESFRESFTSGPAEVDGLETAETAESYMDRFERFVGDLGLRHFQPHEFLVMGASNQSGGPCAGRNALPPDHLWQNLAASARMIDEIRARLGTSVIILSAYRSERYNACIKGAPRSQHKRFCALDLAARGGSVADWWRVAREVRDSSPGFAGGIGRYNSFVHVDTRGQSVDW